MSLPSPLELVMALGRKIRRTQPVTIPPGASSAVRRLPLQAETTATLPVDDAQVAPAKK